jgi:hypothetical protein
VAANRCGREHFLFPAKEDEMEFGVARNIDATEANAPKMGTFDAASLKALESGLLARLAELSDDQRNKVIQRTIDILRSRNAGLEAEVVANRILGGSVDQH